MSILVSACAICTQCARSAHIVQTLSQILGIQCQDKKNTQQGILFGVDEVTFDGRKCSIQRIKTLVQLSYQVANVPTVVPKPLGLPLPVPVPRTRTLNHPPSPSSHIDETREVGTVCLLHELDTDPNPKQDFVLGPSCWRSEHPPPPS